MLLQTRALGVVYSCLVLIYLGQTADLTQNTPSYSSLYYSSIPTLAHWAIFVMFFNSLDCLAAVLLQTSALGVVYPCLLLIYLGQAAYLTQNTASYSSLYYSSIPTPVYWPMFVLALMASVVASQSIITGAHLCHVIEALLKQSVT